jgi:hypothetical protein
LQVTNDPAKAVYNPPASDTTGATGCWVRQDADAFVMTAWFGVIHDGYLPNGSLNPAPTDNTVNFQRFLDFVSYFKIKGMFSPGGFVTSANKIGPFTRLDCGGTSRGSSWIQKAGQTGTLLGIKDGPIPDVRITDFRIICNGLDGANAMLFDAKGAANSNGGLWYSGIRDGYIENCGGIALGFWTGSVAGDYVHQFLTVHNVTAYRSGTPKSRTLSIAGRLAQVTFSGSCEFDGVGFGASNPLSGANMVIGRRYAVGDYFDWMGSDKTGAAISSPPSCLTFSVPTTQGGVYGMIFDGCTNVVVDTPWFEALCRATLHMNGAQVTYINPRLANAASDRKDYGLNQGQGWGFAKDGTSRVTIIGGGNAFGAVDPVSSGGGLIRTLDGEANGGWKLESFAQNFPWSLYTKGITAALTVSGSVLYLGDDDTAVIAGGTSVAPVTFIAVEATSVRPGRTVNITCLGYVRLQYSAGSTNIECGSKSIRFRPGDVLSIVVSDNGSRLVAVADTKRYSQANTPVAAEMEAGEVCWNDNPTVTNAKLLVGWTKDGNGTVQGMFVPISSA